MLPSCGSPSFLGLGWADEGQKNGTIQLAPFGAVPERPSLKSELGYFFVQQACVEYLLSAGLLQASQGMPSSVAWGM